MMDKFEYCTIAHNEKEALMADLMERHESGYEPSTPEEWWECLAKDIAYLRNRAICRDNIMDAKREHVWNPANAALNHHNNYMMDEGAAKAWIGSRAKWTMAETDAVATQHGITFDKISHWYWWAILNDAYIDYATVAKAHSTDNVGFYVDMAKRHMA